MVATITLAVICLALLWFSRDERETHAAQLQATVTQLVTDAERDRAAHRAQIQTLLVHIQAPEIAVLTHTNGQAEPETIMPLDDDEQAQAQDVHTAAEAILAEIRQAEQEQGIVS